VERDTVTEPSKLDQAATYAVKYAQESWVALVNMSFLLPEERIDGAATELAKHMGQSKDTLKRKIQSIQHAHALGHSAEDIKRDGQGAALSRFVKKSNSERYEQSTVLKWNLPGSLREVIRQDTAQMMKILNLNTSEELFDFLHSVFVDLNAHPDELRHLAGELKGKDAQTRAKA
jgi:transcriptional antiterminator